MRKKDKEREWDERRKEKERERESDRTGIVSKHVTAGLQSHAKSDAKTTKPKCRATKTNFISRKTKRFIP